MKRPITLFALLFFILTLLSACSINKTPVPDDCKDSLIYTKLKNPAMVGTLIQIANIEAINKGVYKKKEAIIAIQTIKSFIVEDSITFNTFISKTKSITAKYTAKYQTELLLLSSVFNDLSVDNEISTCDRKLIASLCDKLLSQLE